LSNPTPATLFGPLVILLLSLSYKFPLLLPLAGVSLGILLQLEASSSLILSLLTFSFIIWYRKKFPSISILYSFLAFFATFLPQIIFELKHNFLITKLLLSFLNGDVQTNNQAIFKFPSNLTFNNRLDLYAVTFFEKLKLNFDSSFSFLFIIFLIFIFIFAAVNWSKPVIKIMTIWFYGSLLFFLFYNGNYGSINSYYFLPVFPSFLFSLP
jgi:hypothetical protein